MNMASFTAASGTNAVCPLCLQGILQITTGTAAAALPGGGIGYARGATCPRCQARIDLRVTEPPMTTLIGELGQVATFDASTYTWWHGDTQVYPRLLVP